MFGKIVLAAVVAVMANAAWAEDRLIGQYTAFLGPEDLITSRGDRLESAAAIVAQDRANYHRFGIRHAQDLPDPWFEARDDRLAIPALVRVSDIEAEIIVRHGAFVAVSVFADEAGQMTRMLVQIPG